eukprot:4976360-Amphidinium_carterae.2
MGVHEKHWSRSKIREPSTKSVHSSAKENIRRDLGDWMELYDEHREKFFYNRVTQDAHDL